VKKLRHALGKDIKATEGNVFRKMAENKKGAEKKANELDPIDGTPA